MPYQRILTMQDVSCIGQCSMTVALPILSGCGHEVCILPSALLSTHTGGFGKPAITNLQGELDAIWQHWKREGITFDAIYTGYLGSINAIRVANRIMDELLAPQGRIIVDPAMADHGRLYSGLDETYAAAMKELCTRADAVLPNITEAAMMTGMPYREEYDESYIRTLLSRLCGRNVVLTGVSFDPCKTGAAIRSGERTEFYFHNRYGRSFYGTGDIFASVFTGAWMQNKTLVESVQIAADFTCKAIENTIQNQTHWYGVKFEPVLPDLIDMLR